MGSGNSSQEGKIDNLELFLNDVYEKECLFEASSEEISFIQEGVEILVEKIVHLYLEIVTEFVKCSPNDVQRLRKEINVKLPEKLLLSNKVNVNTADKKPNIIKVGSFYEGTKNRFPDEFDFIFQITRKKEWQHYEWMDPQNVIEVKLFNSVLDKSKQFLKYAFLNKEIHFDKVGEIHGPAYMLIFIYHNGFGKVRDIRADIVPSQSFDVNDDFRSFVKKNVNPKSFRKEVLKIDRYLAVRLAPSLTQTEVHFIRNILSKKHVKVYRILKFLINGHGDGERLESLSDIGKEGYSSYRIKTMMIYHHDECKNPDTDKLGGCVIQVLENIHKYSKIDTLFPMLQKTCIPSPSPCSRQLSYILKSMTQNLIALQSAKRSYDYEKLEIRSVSGKYTDTRYGYKQYLIKRSRLRRYLGTLDRENTRDDHEQPESNYLSSNSFSLAPDVL